MDILKMKNVSKTRASLYGALLAGLTYSVTAWADDPVWGFSVSECESLCPSGTSQAQGFCWAHGGIMDINCVFWTQASYGGSVGVTCNDFESSGFGCVY